MIFGFLRSYNAMYIAGSVGTGFLLASAFPPLEWSNAAWIALIPLMLVLRNLPVKDAFWWGWISGMVFWLLSVSWLLRLAFTGTNIVVAMFAWFSLAAYCALYTGAFALVVAAIWNVLGPDRDLRNIWLVIIVPAVWVGFEFLRSTLFTGFSWNALGVSQYRQLPIIQVAEYGGVYAVSGLMVLVNTALMLTGLMFRSRFKYKTPRRVSVEFLVAMTACLACLWCYFDAVKAFSATLKKSTAVRIASVQPNILQYKKWPGDYDREIYANVKAQTELAIAAKPDFIVWPETVVPTLLKRDPECSAFVVDLASRGCPILVGTLDCDPSGPRDVYFNSSVLVGVDGRLKGQYNKRHLVLFGEYLPLESVFPFIQNLDPLGFCCTPGVTSTVFQLETPAISFSSLICFEDTVASLARESVRNGARLLINQTNDSWFDGSAAAVQHMAHCVFRCVENRVPAVRSANTGVTCFIDSLGRLDILEKDGLKTCFMDFTVGKLDVPPQSMTMTFYNRYGDVPFALPCGLASTLVLCWAVWKNRAVRNRLAGA